MKIAVIGTGYVGLVTGTCLAESGNDVVCVDKDAAKIATLERRRASRSTSRACSNWSSATSATAGSRSPPTWPRRSRAAQLIFIAVGTPQADDGRRRPDGVFAVGDAVGEALRPIRPEAGRRSSSSRAPSRSAPTPSSPSGSRPRAAAHVDVASNPEFLKEGAAIDDFMKPDRVVVGVRRPEVGEVLARAVRPVPAHRAAVPGHVARVGRDDQVRRQRHARDQDQLHQRDGQPVRPARRRHQRRPPRASATTSASASSSSSPAPATAARASRRTSAAIIAHGPAAPGCRCS